MCFRFFLYLWIFVLNVDLSWAQKKAYESNERATMNAVQPENSLLMVSHFFAFFVFLVY